jgi:hypothetical protein
MTAKTLAQLPELIKAGARDRRHRFNRPLEPGGSGHVERSDGEMTRVDFSEPSICFVAFF